MLLKVAIPGYAANDEESVAFFLIVMILVFTAMSLLFLALLFISKLAEIRRNKNRALYQPVVEQALLGILFENRSIGSVRSDADYRKLSRKRFFRALLIENTLSLHSSFAGDYQQRLEQFYRESGLDEISFRKLRSMRWHIRCEGVNELSRMQVSEAFPKIRQLSYARNNTLKLEAMVGIIRLQGAAGLLLLADHTEPVNDWIQLNIISVVKNAAYPEVPDFGSFLESANESVVVLGIRLVTTFGQMQHFARVREIVSTSTSRRILLGGQFMPAALDASNLQTGAL